LADNLEVLKKGYSDFSDGDIGAATEPWPDDFVWEGPNSEELPGSGTHEGKDAALQALESAVGSWDAFRLEIDEFVGEGDTIVALGHTEASKGDNTVKQPVVHVWRFEDGAPKRIQVLSDTFQTAQALGLAGGGSSTDDDDDKDDDGADG
jgi:hypothetical protein